VPCWIAGNEAIVNQELGIARDNVEQLFATLAAQSMANNNDGALNTIIYRDDVYNRSVPSWIAGDEAIVNQELGITRDTVEQLFATLAIDNDNAILAWVDSLYIPILRSVDAATNYYWQRSCFRNQYNINITVDNFGNVDSSTVISHQTME